MKTYKKTLITSILALGFVAAYPAMTHAHESELFGDDHAAEDRHLSSRSVNLTVPISSEAKLRIELMMQEAVAKTASQEFDKAKSIYESVAQEAPATGLPALGRFLSLTASTEESEAFISSVLEDDALPLRIKASTLIQSGKSRQAAEFLKSESQSFEDDDFETVLYAAQTLYRYRHQPEAISILIDRSNSTSIQSEQALVAEQLLGWPDTLEHSNPTRVVSALAQGLTSSSFDPVQSLSHLDQLITEWQRTPRYRIQSQSFLATKQSPELFFNFFKSCLAFHEGDDPKALSLLANAMNNLSDMPTYEPLFLAHRIRLLESTGRVEEAQSLASRMLSRASKKSQIQHAFDRAKQTFNSGDAEKARGLLDALDRAQLGESNRAEYETLRVRIAAREKQLHEMIDLVAEFLITAENDRILVFNRSIFEELHNTDEHLEVERIIRDKFANEKSEEIPPGLWLLAAEAAKFSRIKPNELEARYQYIKAAPQDVDALVRLVQESVPLALELSKVTPDELDMHSIPRDEPARLANLAEQSAISLINIQPYSAEPMRLLMELYRGLGRSDDVISSVPAIVGSSSTNHKILGNCGYVLATEGFPKQALEYYNRALEIDPDDMAIKMNRASCYTRLGRWSEAVEFYRDGLENGYNGKPYHVHEFLQRLWAIAVTRESIEECIEYFETVATRNDIPWQPTILKDMIALFIKENRFENALTFQKMMVAQFQTNPESIDENTVARSFQIIASGYAGQNQIDLAEQTINDGMELLHFDEELVIGLQKNKATLWVQAGRIDEAVEILQIVAAESTSTEAQDSLYFAARLADQSGEVLKARSLYGQFLTSSSTSFDLRREASKRLAAIGIQ